MLRWKQRKNIELFGHRLSNFIILASLVAKNQLIRSPRIRDYQITADTHIDKQKQNKYLSYQVADQIVLELSFRVNVCVKGIAIIVCEFDNKIISVCNQNFKWIFIAHIFFVGIVCIVFVTQSDDEKVFRDRHSSKAVHRLTRRPTIGSHIGIN